MLNYKLVIFDFDGTLFETQEAILHATKETFIRMNTKIPNDEIIQKIISQARPLKEQMLLLLPDLINNTEYLELYINTYRDIYDNSLDVLKKTTPFIGVLDLISILYIQGVKLAIVSNKDDLAIKKALDYFDVLKYFDMIIGSGTRLNKKPDPMIYRDLICPKFSQFNTLETLMVGDTDIDMLFAKNSGIKSCFANYGHGDIDTLSYVPDYIIENFQDLENIISVKNGMFNDD